MYASPSSLFCSVISPLSRICYLFFFCIFGCVYICLSFEFWDWLIVNFEALIFCVIFFVQCWDAKFLCKMEIKCGAESEKEISFRCVQCGFSVTTLYIQYSPGNIRLMKCVFFFPYLWIAWTAYNSYLLCLILFVWFWSET